MRLTEALVAFTSRRSRWSEGHVFAIVPEQLGVAEGLRAGLAIGVMLAATLLCAVPDLAWSAIAAFWICLADPVGSRRTRRTTLLAFTCFGTTVLAASSYGAHWGPVAGGATLFVLVLLCGLTRSYPSTFGPAAPQVGLIASVAVVIGVATPRALPGALALGAYFLLGALWATLLCLYLWPIRSDTPARRALLAIFSRLGDMTASLATLDATAGGNRGQWERYDSLDRRATRIALERGFQIVARADGGRGRFTRDIAAANDVFAALIALGHLRTTGQPFERLTERAWLAEFQRLLWLAAARPAQDGATLRSGASALLQALEGQAGAFARALRLGAHALLAMAQDTPPPAPSAPTSLASAQGGPRKLPRTVWRHAVRIALAVLVSYSLGRWLDVTFSYWGSIATIVVMQPLMANTWLRVLERAVGSLAGGLIAATLLALASAPAQIALAVVVLTVASIGLRLVSYGVFVIFLTPMFMLLSDFIHPAGGLISARVINEALGAVVGTAACLALWPERQRRTLIEAVASAIGVNMAYVAAVLRGDSDAQGAVERLHRDAGLASSRAETARERLLFEGRARAARLDQVGAILMALRAVCGAVVVLRIAHAAPQLGDAPRAAACEDSARRLQLQLAGTPADGAPAPQADDDLGRAIEALIVAVDAYAAGKQIWKAPRAAAIN